MINDIFDALNTKHMFGFNGFKRALNPDNVDEVKELRDRAHTYLKGLRATTKFNKEWNKETLLTSTNYKTGAIGLLCALDNIIEMYDEFVVEKNI